MENVVRSFLMLLTTIDPIGTLSVFVGVTSGATAAQQRRIAVRCILWSTIILVGFVVLGQLLLDGLGIQLEAFQISGGIILFLFGLQMIFGTGAAAATNADPDHDAALFPLAIPSIASPGSILAVVLLTDNDVYTITQQAVTTGLLLLVLAITLLLLLQANRIHRRIGPGGANILTRVMGLILAALAVQMVLDVLPKIAQLVRAG